MNESPSRREKKPWRDKFLPSSLAHAGFKFALSCKSGCRVSPLSLGAPSGADGAVLGARVNLVFQTVEGGDPGRRKRLAEEAVCYRWDREVGGGEAV
jgi:hypothetical protein